MVVISELAPFQSHFRDSPIRGKDLAIHALGVGEWMPPGRIDRPRGTGDWMLMAFHQDTWIESGGQRALVPGPFVMVWSHGKGHWYGHPDRRWRHSWIHADGRTFARIIAAAGVPLDRPLLGVDPRALELPVAAMHDEVRRHAPCDAAIIEHHLHILARGIARAAGDAAPRVPERWLAARADLEARLGERLRLADLARRAGCSVPHFCAEFQRWFRIAPIDHAIRLRMHRAAILLRDRNQGIKQIARAVGYDDLHHFSKLFKKHHGLAPRRMREALVAGG